MTRRRRAIWLVVAFLVVDAVVGVLAVSVLPRLGLWPGSGPSSSPAPTPVPTTTSNPALAGYPVLNGNQGYPVAVGRPWGAPCAPITMVAAPGTPEPLTARLGEVIAEAAAGGVPVLAVGAAPDGRPVQTVQVAADRAAAPTLPDGRPQQVLWFFQTTLDASGRSETIRTMSTAVYLRSVGDAEGQRRALRSLLARSFGLAGATRPGSGLAEELSATLDGFSAADLAALRTMAGCT
jgi:hypothetical protein